MNAITPTHTRYRKLTVGIHWFMLALMIAVYAFIELRVLFPKGVPMRDTFKALHFMLGLSVLGLVALRLYARMTSSTPAIVPPLSKLHQLEASIMHFVLYVFMIAMPILGWLLLSAEGKPIPFFGLNMPALIAPNKEWAESIKEIHETIGTLGYWAIGLHAVAGLYHHYFKKDNTLQRMLPR